MSKIPQDQKKIDPFHWHRGMISATFFSPRRQTRQKKFESPKVFCYLAEAAGSVTAMTQQSNRE
jgi:hypothetical protein